MHIESTEVIHKCEACQLHAPVKANPKHNLVSIIAAWPLYKWGINIIGPFPEAAARYQMTGEIVTDNGKKFAKKPFSLWCKELQIKQVFSSVAYAHSNGQVERMNHSTVEGIKARLGRYDKNWKQSSPAEIGVNSRRVRNINEEANEFEVLLNLDLLEEAREQAAIEEVGYKKKVEAFYNIRVRKEVFKPGDLVLRNNEASRQSDTGKLGPKWEGPYVIKEAHMGGSYKLNDMEGRKVPRH
ncbi:uncharacterized protein LOC143570015 [Bidens hawaiensis]|uniref:uncharacterized protein LOC143570015 n=1 Tax=Bidens hawaiensis TaxID=980011 RepID=UPI004049328D